MMGNRLPVSLGIPTRRDETPAEQLQTEPEATTEPVTVPSEPPRSTIPSLSRFAV